MMSNEPRWFNRMHVSDEFVLQICSVLKLGCLWSISGVLGWLLWTLSIAYTLLMPNLCNGSVLLWMWKLPLSVSGVSKDKLYVSEPPTEMNLTGKCVDCSGSIRVQTPQVSIQWPPALQQLITIVIGMLPTFRKLATKM